MKLFHDNFQESLKVTEQNRNSEIETRETYYRIPPASHIMVDDETGVIGDEDDDERRRRQ